MIPQVFLDNLRRAYIEMKDICLIVYDECHHAMKDHPYNCVMREFYFNSEYRPKVLGLTACPTTGSCLSHIITYLYDKSI